MRPWMMLKMALNFNGLTPHQVEHLIGSADEYCKQSVLLLEECTRAHAECDGASILFKSVSLPHHAIQLNSGILGMPST